MFNVIRVRNYEELSTRAFEIILKTVREKPESVIGFPAGSTPLGLYRMLIEDHRVNGTSWSGCTAFSLDEYVGMPGYDSESCYSFLHHNLFNHLDIPEENIHVPSGTGDLAASCEQYNELLEAHPIDVQILGIGSNGHIGFNEPETSFDFVTHVVDLNASTIRDNARFFDNDEDRVPAKAITMGIANLMAAKKIVLLASGSAKANAIRAAILGVITEYVPASVLKMHPDVVMIIDEEAASALYKEKR